MKKLYFSFILFVFFSFCKAQSCLSICDSDLLNGPFPFSGNLVTGSINYGMPGGITNPHFHDVDYNIGVGTICTSTKSCSQQVNDLFYKVYYPSTYTKQQFIDCPLPCVIAVHPGEFSDCSKYTNIQAWYQDFAKLGFVAIAVEYRRGALADPAGNVSVENSLAVYRAVQDVRGAISSIIYRQTQEGITVDDDYRIDTSRMFLAGESAGGVAVLGAAYYNQNMMDELFPAVAPGTTVENVCGSIGANWYNNGGNNVSSYYRQHIKGILIQSAGMYVPYSFLSNPRSFFEVTPFIPIIFFHGQKDATFNVNSTTLSFSLNTSTYDTTSFCIDTDNGIFKVNGNVIEYGSKGIYNLLLQDPSYPLVPSEFYKDCQMGHTLQTDMDPPPYLTEFGTGVSNHDDITQYIISRAAIFFGNIINGNASSLGKKIFVECKNNRIKCNTANNFDNTCCDGCVTNDDADNKCNTNQTQLP